jgi:cellulose biosynthesis protein BcsQ
LEVQSQAINQLSNISLPQDSWKNVHLWLKDLIDSCSNKLGQGDCLVLIDCNPSFSAYTAQSLIASHNLIIPCSSDGSSARAIDNLAQLVYGIGISESYKNVNFATRCNQFNISLPMIHSVILNRSTQYNKGASKAFHAMFQEIKKRVEALRVISPQSFQSGQVKFFDIPDNHSVAVVSSHLGFPIAKIQPGKYRVHDTHPQINPEPLDRYKKSIDLVSKSL